MNDSFYNEFTNKFTSNEPKVLFLGIESELTEEIINQKWSCIITSSRDRVIDSKFVNENRRPRPIYNEYEARSIKFSTKSPCVIYLRDEKKPLSLDEKDSEEENVKKIFGYLSNILFERYGGIYFSGYNPQNIDELSSKFLYSSLKKFPENDKLILFFDINRLLDVYISELINAKKAILSYESLTNSLKKFYCDQDIDEVEATETEETSIHLYINSKLISINRTDLFETSGFATLLSDTEILIPEIPTYLTTAYYQRFLQANSPTPLWYGYEKKYYLHREFEDLLEKGINEEIAKPLTKSLPIVLHGPTCSSKTMALGAIAYRYYRAKKYPIIYIANDDINLSSDSQYFNALDLLLQRLEGKGANKILLFWDNSSNINQYNVTKQLHNSLIRRGRKIVLVTSAYDLHDYSTKVIKVQASAILTSKEKEDLIEKVIRHTGISKDQFYQWAKKVADTNLLVLLYRFFADLLGNKISLGIYTEVKWNFKRFATLVSSVSEEVEKQMSQMALALIKAGLITPENKGGEKESSEEMEIAMRDFCISIAVASEIKVDLPYTMAMRIFTYGRPINNQFHRAISQLSTLSYLRVVPINLDDNCYDYLVSFRTPLEASLYLSNINLTDEERIDYIIKILNKASFNYSDYKVSELRTIEKLLILIGPNSQQVNGRDSKSRFGEYWPKIIDALKNLRIKERIFEPQLICQEVTYMRECYGSNMPMRLTFAPEERKEKLEEAFNIAQQAIRRIHPSYGRNAINSLIVESVHCQLEIINIDKQQNIEPIIRFNYKEIFEQLLRVIASTPNNNYPYTALLRTFVAVFDSSAVNDITKLEYSTQILSLIDNVDNKFPDVIDNPYYCQYKTQVLSRIDTKKYDRFFDEMLSKGRADCIYLKARTELHSANIDWITPLDSIKKQRAQEVLDYLNKYGSVTNNDNNCLFIKLNLYWLMNNEQPLFNADRQFTNLSIKDWTELNNLCSQAISNCEGRILNLVIGHDLVFRYVLALSYAELFRYKECIEELKQFEENMFSSAERLKIWHIICDNGIPRKFIGTLKSQKIINQKKYIRIQELEKDILYHDLKTSEIDTTLNDIELGLGYMGFQAYRDLEKI